MKIKTKNGCVHVEKKLAMTSAHIVDTHLEKRK